MLTLYTAIGELKFKKNANGKPVPIVINNHQEYGMSVQELILWSCLAFQILTYPELQAAYHNRLQTENLPEDLPMSHYLNRLLFRGLITKGCGMTGIDSLYDLVGKLHIIPVPDSFLIRFLSCLILLKNRKITLKNFFTCFKKENHTAVEKTILLLSKRLSPAVAELITCMKQDLPIKREQDILEHLYHSTDETCDTLAANAPIGQSCYPILQAVCNLYLNKQICFHQF